MKYKPNKDGRTPLHLAGFCNTDESILKLLLAPSDLLEMPKFKDANGRSIVQMAELHSVHDWGEILQNEQEPVEEDSI